jgi:hypothetical protein
VSDARVGDRRDGRDDQLAILLPIRVRVLGPQHPHTLAARQNLALWTAQAGDAESAAK